MNLNDYIKGAMQTDKEHFAISSEQAAKMDYAIGLAGETGEVCDLVKHNIAHREVIDLCKLAKELGDVMWYLVHVAESYKIPMELVLALNNRKLTSRYSNGYSDAASLDRHNIEAKANLEEFFYTELEKYKEAK